MSKQNIFALCRLKGQLVVRRIQINQPLQTELEKVLNDQEKTFRKGVDSEVVFNGNWHPEENELLIIENNEEVAILVEAVTSNATSLPTLDLKNFGNEPIKGIFTGSVAGGNIKILLQLFSSIQFLSQRKLPIFRGVDGNTFEKLEGPLFTINNKLVAIIEDKKIKFKSFSNLKIIFDLSNLYREATDEDLSNFSNHQSILVGNHDKFVKDSDTTIRKLIHTINSIGILDKYKPKEIKEKADKIGLFINIVENKIKLPAEKSELKDLLRFLVDDLYEAALSGDKYITNSKKKK